jgi:hypothetical protein
MGLVADWADAKQVGGLWHLLFPGMSLLKLKNARINFLSPFLLHLSII